MFIPSAGLQTACGTTWLAPACNTCTQDVRYQLGDQDLNRARQLNTTKGWQHFDGIIRDRIGRGWRFWSGGQMLGNPWWVPLATTWRSWRMDVEFVPALGDKYVLMYMIKGSLGGETSVLRTFRMSGKELVKERVSPGKSSSGKELVQRKELVKERVSQGKS